MNSDQVLDVFRDAGALLEGHFILSSGRRSPVFLQKALVFSRPDLSEKLCKALAEKLTAAFGQIDVVAGPAVGGVGPRVDAGEPASRVHAPHGRAHRDDVPVLRAAAYAHREHGRRAVGDRPCNAQAARAVVSPAPHVAVLEPRAGVTAACSDLDGVGEPGHGNRRRAVHLGAITELAGSVPSPALDCAALAPRAGV